MATSPAKALILVATIAVFIEMAAAANHTVGAPGGRWDLRTNLSSWASGISFKTGDNLIFSYDNSSHDVLEVNKSNYNSCTTTGPIKTYSSGNDVIPLSSQGNRYFICGVPTHCSNGMKVQIDTTATSPTSSPPPSSSTSPPTSGSSPSTPSTPTTAGSPPPESSTPGGSTPPSAAGRRSLEGKVAAAGLISVGMLMVLAL